MSMQTNIQYGYGIITSHIKVEDIEKLKALIHRLPEYEKDLNVYFEAENITEPTIKDYYTYMEDYNGLAGVFETLIYEEEGIELCACSDDNGDFYLLYPESYPWYMGKLDLSMTEDKLKQLFQRYVALLTDKQVDIDYQRCEKCG